MNTKPFWIAIEGGDGVGKTTAAENVTALLNQGGSIKADWIPACGAGSGLGSDIRQVLKTNGLPSFTEECLFAAILPLMLKHININASNGIATVTDRSHVSSIVYSTIAKGNPQGWRYLYDEAVSNRVPDIIFYLYCDDLNEQIDRATRSKRIDSIDRYDEAGREFYNLVNAGFKLVLGESRYKDITIPICVDSMQPDDLAKLIVNLINTRRYFHSTLQLKNESLRQEATAER